MYIKLIYVQQADLQVYKEHLSVECTSAAVKFFFSGPRRVNSDNYVVMYNILLYCMTLINPIIPG